jgi:hypothetical protein
LIEPGSAILPDPSGVPHITSGQIQIFLPADAMIATIELTEAGCKPQAYDVARAMGSAKMQTAKRDD